MLSAFQFERIGEHLQQFRGDAFGFVAVMDVFEHDGEFVAAETRDGRAVAHAGTQTFTDRFEHAVADGDDR